MKVLVGNVFVSNPEEMRKTSLGVGAWWALQFAFVCMCRVSRLPGTVQATFTCAFVAYDFCQDIQGS